MIIAYIIEICVAVDIAILGIAYPIIVDKISNIGDKYSSQYISVLFNNEFPQKPIKISIRKRQFKISIFKLTLYLTILSFLLLIFQVQPAFGWDNFLINNSAKLAVLFFTTLLIIFFFIWLDNVILYNGNSKSLLKKIVATYDSLKDDDEIKAYQLKAINELTFYAIEKQDEHLQETLLDFYFCVFNNIRHNHEKSKPLVYPIDLYFLVNKLNSELANNQNKKLLALEHRAVSGMWLLGEGFHEIIISEETYNWLWHNLNIICENERDIKMFWANSDQYFDYRLRSIYPEYNHATGGNVNDISVKKRDEERWDFLEFHFALGGLLLYKGQNNTLKYIFEYSQSLPPKYVLLPESMTQIFKWLENFRNEFRVRKTSIEIKYYFSELDNLGTKRQVNYWICRYLSVLFIRQYSLSKYYTLQDFTSLPILPDNVIELNRWLSNVPYFKSCLLSTLQDVALLKDLGFSKIAESKKEEFEVFFNDLETAIKEKIGEQKLTAPLSNEKVKLFLTSTNTIISEAFGKYDNIFNQSTDGLFECDLRHSVTGGNTIITKSAFTEDDIPLVDYDRFYASHIASYYIKRYIPNSFEAASTKRFLLNKDNLILGLEKIVGGNKNAIIVAVNIGYEIKERIDQSPFKSITEYIPSSDSQNVLYVLNKSDLPRIEHKALNADMIQELQLISINDGLKLYASVIDLNTQENKSLKDKWLPESEKNNLDLKILLSIAFACTLFWRNDRSIIQLNIASQYKEQGIQSDINEIEALRNPKKNVGLSKPE